MQIQNPQLQRLSALTSEPRVVRAVLWVVTALLAIVAVWLAAQLTWQLIAPSSKPASGPIQAQAEQTSARATGRAAVLTELDLFGTAVTAETDSRNAPKTNLNVRLLGVSASSVPAKSAAIIEKDRQQEVYVIGDNIVGTNVGIEEIYSDRVILDNNGVLETLELEGIGELGPGLSLSVDDRQTTQAQPERQSFTPQATQRQGAQFNNPRARDAYRRMQQGDTGALLDYIRVSPAMQGGELAGYRLSPGKFPDLFADAGFKTGDIAVALNGQDLTDVASAQVALQELRSASRITVTVLRDEAYLDLELAVPAQ
ncbi:type II secretion system protein GspC [Pseudidiomarina salilacus]|uniref:type II secretion system protein GspC n=1 Tax=Pseudidiomarina salilacus TaxID=3384452 RepID=UPI00398559E6